MYQRLNWKDAKAPTLTVEQVARLLWVAAFKRAKQRHLDFDLSMKVVLDGVAAGRCAVTGLPFDMRAKPHQGPDLPFRASLDRIDNVRGYHDDNVRVTCKLYNDAKMAWNDEDVLLMAIGLVTTQAAEFVQWKRDEGA